ncbi:hypothetical protein BJY00DRAFT_309743 [Aspergillus carlsbadensis]|nr:hypothetical protein BJY00DRAFT_309743 [Aspergillus carlsbadensis]
MPRAGAPKDLKEALARCPERVPQLVQRKKWSFDREDIRKAATTKYTPIVFRAIAMTLASQRKQILQKGRLLLPLDDLYNMGIRARHHILDGQAIVVAKKLQQHKKLEQAEFEYYFPDWKWNNCGTSVYYVVECNREAAMILHQAGFTDVDQVDELGYSPVSALDIPTPGKKNHGTYKPATLSSCLESYLRMCAWYEKRGARLDRAFGLYHQTPLHHIARRIGKSSAAILASWYGARGDDNQGTTTLEFAAEWIKIVKPMKSDILKRIFKDTVHRDLLACPCAHGGGLPMNVLINETIRGRYSPKEVSLLATMLLRASCLPDTEEHDQTLAPVFLRACTFACMMSIPHTCESASLNRFKRLPGEYRRHHSDDYVDSLVSEFVAKYRDLKLPLCLFLTECWPAAMEKAAIGSLENALSEIRIE